MDVDDAANIGIRAEEEGKDGSENAVDLNAIPPVDETNGREGSQEALFMSEGSDEDEEAARSAEPGVVPGEDDKKKLAMDTSYEGFSIYGRILCLVVKRKGVVKGKVIAGGTGQAMMEDFIASTQAAREGRVLED